MMNSGIDLRVIYTVNGDVKSRAYIAKHMVDLAEKDISVAVGESKPMGGGREPYSFFEECYIDDKFVDEEKTEGKVDLVYKEPKEAGIIPNGVEDLAQKLSKDKHVVFSIAPMTNIGRLIQQYPYAAKNI